MWGSGGGFAVEPGACHGSDEEAMDLETMRHAKEIVLEVTSLITLAEACAALLLIACWGLKKIWMIINS